ncbi:carboxypeptidase-like regulatory domain-containing protein [Tenacibaculum piscium]|uniref:carboxypeptidase-like regulatory domain-containing protein n=1 Tax=Tenacibaculum piscium TaxID=1458515 RepID=UPI001F44CDBA|nr:carboxypeptidase-like regulatory domain-containing protein [Tenacibaculum piscium]
MKNKQLLIIRFFLVFFSGVFFKIQAQENNTYRKFLYADVRNKTTLLENVNIINLNTKQGTFTTINGEFKILAKPTDSLKISCIGYKTIIFEVKNIHFGMQKNIFILNKKKYKLDEVYLKKHSLTGSLTSDIKNIKNTQIINAKTLNLPYAGSKILTSTERKLYTAMGAKNILSLDYLLNSASGRIKKLQKLQTIENLEKKVKKIKNTYTLSIIKEYNIKETHVYKFIYFCTTDEKFNQIYNSTAITMIRFLKNKAELFKKQYPADYQL